MDKLVILARGLGTRMRRSDDAAVLDAQQASVAETGVKALIPTGRPFLDYVLSAVAASGYRRVCLVVGPQHDVLRDYYGRTVQPRRLRVEFAVQEQPRGTADAVLAAEAFADGDSVAVLNSDNYYPVEALAALRRLDGPGLALFDWETMVAKSNVSEERLRQFAIARIDAEGCLEQILEKPDVATRESLPQPVWVSMNCWRFGPAIFESCRSIAPSPRGELEIPDAVVHSMRVLGQRYQVVKVAAPVLDLSTRRDVAAVAAMLADREVDF